MGCVTLAFPAKPSRVSVPSNSQPLILNVCHLPRGLKQRRSRSRSEGADGVPVRKPNKQEFVRVHPDPDYQVQMAILELKSENEVYAVTPEVAPAIPGENRMVSLTTTINRQGTVFLWPVPLPTPDGRALAWHVTARDAAGRACSKWVRVVANMSEGAYDIWEAEADIAAPEWPDYAFSKLLEIGFGNGRLIDCEEHPVLQQLLGRL